MKRNSFVNFVSYILLVAYMLYMLYYAIVPINLPITLPFDSKRLLYHFVEFFILGILLLNATRNKSISLTVGIIYAIALEIIQLWVPTRVFDLYDLAANSLGAIVSTITVSRFFKSK